MKSMKRDVFSAKHSESLPWFQLTYLCASFLSACTDDYELFNKVEAIQFVFHQELLRIFWDVMSCNVVEIDKVFGGEFNLHLQFKRGSEESRTIGFLLPSDVCSFSSLF
jgi:hypothetical protein